MSDHPLADTPEQADVVSRETVYRGAVWDVARETLSFRGEQFSRDFVDHPGASAVVALDDNHQVVLLRQYRHPVRSRNWELPAGLLDVEGEDPAEAAHRELAEETNFEARSMEHMVTLNVSPGGSNEVIHLFLATGLRKVESGFVPTAEEADMEVTLWPLDEAVAACLRGDIANQITYCGLLTAHARLSR